jgi:hypothetical protein
MNKLRFGIFALLLSGLTSVQGTVIFSDDFESGSTNWTIQGDGILWHISEKVPPTNVVNGTTSPTNVVYGTNHTLHFGYEDHYGLTEYNPSTPEYPTSGSGGASVATSVSIDLTHVQNAQLSFRMREHFDNGYYSWCSNGRSVGVLVNNQWVTGFERYAVLWENQDPDGWETVTLDLSSCYGSVIKIQFAIEVFPPVWDPSVEGELYFEEAWRDRGDGWYINNIVVQGQVVP